MEGNEKEPQWKDLRGVKIEPPQTTRNDKIRFAFFLGGILLVIILVIVILAKI